MKKYYIVIGLMIFGAFILQNCTKAIIDETGTTPTLPDRIIKYSPDIETIMFNHCTTCHSGNAPSANVDLSTYQNVRFYTEQGNLIHRMNNTNNPMPPSGVLSIEQRQLLDKWILDGYLEN